MFRLLGDGLSKNDKKGVSSFQAFCISTASRVGTGNLAGIAIALSLGGPGSIFWMWLIALIGAASSFVESTLAQIYKEKDSNGTFRGGPAYYMQKGLNKRWAGVIFSIIIVPIMALAYIGVAIFVIGKNITAVPKVISLIFENAFGFKEFAGGTLGGAMLLGIKRGLFSNEAGMGSSPNAAATASVSHPVKQGLIQTLGVFTDTIIICSCTAFIILLSNVELNFKLSGIKLTQNALSSQIGPAGSYFIAICILLFAFSSIIGNYYYGESNIEFLSDKKIYLIVYRILVISMVLIGSIASLDLVWTLADIFMGFMAIINLIAIVFLSNIAFKALKDYDKQKKSGIKEPVFKSSSIPEIKNATEWE